METTIAFKPLQTELDAVFNHSVGRPAIQKEDLAAYLYLVQQAKSTTSFRNDYLFRSVFSSYFGNKFMTRDDKDFFFGCFDLIEKKNLNFEFIFNHYRNAKKGFQFSFTTKMLHLLNTDLPIYDSHVGTILTITDTYRNKKPIYEKLIKFYEDSKTNNILTECINQFDTNFPDYKKEISSTKKIDFIIWAMGKIRAKEENKKKREEKKAQKTNKNKQLQ